MTQNNQSAPTRPKASDLSTLDLLAFIERINHEKADTPGLRGYYVPGEYDARGCWPMGLCNVWDFPDDWFGLPRKVVEAKLSKLLKRGYLDGCDCGCRGDWQLTAKGREVISHAA